VCTWTRSTSCRGMGSWCDCTDVCDRHQIHWKARLPSLSLLCCVGVCWMQSAHLHSHCETRGRQVVFALNLYWKSATLRAMFASATRDLLLSPFQPLTVHTTLPNPP
jgi:hypothetical protein